jgi:imidazolonepropionase-like amidohydrolase
LAEAAVQAVSNVELLLSAGASEASVAIDNQFRVFESYEHGLLVTWEIQDALICVPKFRV